jgi:hypothetical protein
MPEEVDDMRTTRYPIRHLLPLVGIGLMLASLFGSPALPAASAASVDPFAYQNDRGAQNPWGQQDYRGQRDPWGQQDPWGYRYDRPSRRRDLPDRYTIHKGKKCELQCTRIPGTREYNCREYRC